MQLVVVGDIFLFNNTIYRSIKVQYDKKGGRFMRKLASIQKIKRVMPIPDADRLELVQILGWQCVGGKGEFHEGDCKVYM